MGERGVEVPAVLRGHVELAGDVGLRGPELAGVPEQTSYGVEGAQLDDRAVDGAGLRPVPGPQEHGQLAAHEGRERRCQRGGDPGGAGRVLDAGRARPGPGRHGGHCRTPDLVKVSWLTSM